MLTIKIEGFDRLRANLNGIKRGLGEQAATMALNKVGEKAKVEMRRTITNEYNLKVGEVNSRLRLIRANRNKLNVVLDPYAMIKRGRAMNVIHFLSALQARGVAYKARGSRGMNKAILAQLKGQLGFIIKRSGGVKTIPGAFIQNRGRTVFIREGKERLPIKAVSTISIPQMFAARKSIGRVERKIQNELSVEFDRAVKILLDRYR